MFEFTVIPDNGDEFKIEAGMRDLRMWEKTHKGRGMGSLGDKSTLTATIMFEIAYAACKRQGKIPAGLTGDEFAEQYEIDIEDDDEPEADEDVEAPGDPTPSAV